MYETERERKREERYACVPPCLFKFFQRLLRPKDKLQRDIFTVTVRLTSRVQNMLCYFLQCGQADDPRVTQSRNNLILQQPADLNTHTHTQVLEKKLMIDDFYILTRLTCAKVGEKKNHREHPFMYMDYVTNQLCYYRFVVGKKKKKKSGLISRITKSCNGTTVSCGKDLHLATVYICCQASSSLQDACQ